MQQSTIKKFLITSGAIAVPAVIFYLVLFFEKIFISTVNEGFNAFMQKLHPYALGLLFVALAIIIFMVLFSILIEKREEKRAELRKEEAAQLQKYVTKKTKK